MSRLLLRPLATRDEEEARQAHEELAKENFEFLLSLRPEEPWPRYVARMNRLSVHVMDGWVPATFLIAEAEGCLVGRVSVRHRLNDYLLKEGGHIGYAVRPAYRRRGYATAILGYAVQLAKHEGVDHVLVTCDDDNAASAAVIERCGGVLEDSPHGQGDSPSKRRYWIATT